MRDATLLFLIKKDSQKIVDIFLPMKKRGFGAGRYNGVGGKVEAGESIEDALKRETKEEVSVIVDKLKKSAEITFIFPHNPKFDQLVHVYLADEWIGEPKESEEMKPCWFRVIDIPYKEMWPADIFWIPRVLEGKFIRARFVLGEGDAIREQEVIEVE